MDINNLIDRGGVLYAPNKEKPFSGSVFDLYDNGQKKLNGRYRNGIKNGKWTWWNMDGGIDRAGSYKNGLMNGLWQFYYSNGNLKGKGLYKEGNETGHRYEGILLHGQHGKWTYWDEDGQKSAEGIFKDGDGLWTYWEENGTKSGQGSVTMILSGSVHGQLDPCG
jgi:antitoxin component YwqK of YwqJK toxin-antitoxin module